MILVYIDTVNINFLALPVFKNMLPDQRPDFFGEKWVSIFCAPYCMYKDFSIGHRNVFATKYKNQG